jgi:hypothetical protein
MRRAGSVILAEAAIGTTIDTAHKRRVRFGLMVELAVVTGAD